MGSKQSPIVSFHTFNSKYKDVNGGLNSHDRGCLPAEITGWHWGVGFLPVKIVVLVGMDGNKIHAMN